MSLIIAGLAVLGALLVGAVFDDSRRRRPSIWEAALHVPGIPCQRTSQVLQSERNNRSGAQSKYGGRAIEGGFRCRLAETEGGVGRTLVETGRAVGETDARSIVPTQNA